VALVESVAGVRAFLDETAPQPFHAVPRGDGIVLGGTAQDGDERLGVADADTAAILVGMTARLPARRGAARRARPGRARRLAAMSADRAARTGRTR